MIQRFPVTRQHDISRDRERRRLPTVTAGRGAAALLLFLLLPVPLFPFGKNKVNYDASGWRVLKTVHFDIHYPEGMEELGLKTADIAEEGYVHIANYLRHELTDTVPLVVYPSRVEFQNNNIIPFILGEGTGGFTESIKNRVVVPYTGSDHEFRHVLVHELVHAFQFNILFSDTSGENLSRFYQWKVPLWLVEGMSEYLSIGYDETADMVMRDALFNEKYADLTALTELRISNAYLLYKEGQSFYYFLERTYGRNVIGDLFRDIRDLPSLEDALWVSFGKDLEELNREWLRFYKKRYFHLVKDKNFDDDEGKQVTFHEKTESSFNTCPAVSPDGKRIAYLTNRDVYSSLVVASLEKKREKGKKGNDGREEREERILKVLVSGDSGGKFEGMHFLTNYLTWIPRGNTLAFVAQSYGRDTLFLMDADTGRIMREFTPPMREIRDPSLSPDGSRLVFTGSGNGATDIYVLTLDDMKLRRVTDDRYTERNPKITGDNRFIIFSSDMMSPGAPSDANFSLYRLELATGRNELLASGGGNFLQGDLSPDGTRLLYISNKSGIYNAYIMDLEKRESRKVTDVLSGVFYPRWFPDGKRAAFVSYQNMGYDIFVKELDDSVYKKDTGLPDTRYMSQEFRGGYFPLTESRYGGYQPWLTPDIVSLGVVGAVNQGLMGFLQFSMSDMLGNHRLVFTSNFIRQEGDNDYNFDLGYYYLRYRWDFGFGVFRQKNPFFLYSLESINDLIHNVNFGIISMDSYGCYGIASYPFSRFFRFDMKATSSRYERDYSNSADRPDVFTNINKLSVSLNYDSVLWGGMVPADGFRGRIEAERTFDFTGRDAVYSDVGVDLRKYFLINKRYVFAFRGVGGKIFGDDSGFFKYYIGGFNTLRGHPLLEYGGRNMFFVNSEFRFTFIEGIKFGWPLFFGVGNIGGVIFADFGSAWDKNFQYVNRANGRFQDLKSDFGFGFRFAIFPVIILKLDYAWPYDKKSVGKRDIIFSIGFEY